MGLPRKTLETVPTIGKNHKSRTVAAELYRRYFSLFDCKIDLIATRAFA
jgi:hypothetical protein